MFWVMVDLADVEAADAEGISLGSNRHRISFPSARFVVKYVF